MAKRPQAVYDPGELDRVRRNLGSLDAGEAKRLAALLGGEVGVERAAQPPKTRPPARDETVTVSVKGKTSPQRRTDAPPIAAEQAARAKEAKQDKKKDVSDDPSSEIKLSYRERLKMDRFMALPEYEIKNPSQVFLSMVSLFGEPADLVTPEFVTKRMNEYYSRLEALVTAARTMLPRNNAVRSEAFKRKDPFAFKVLDVIRQWNVERIAADLGKFQAKPRHIAVQDFKEILKAFYGPFYILGDLEPELHVRDAFRALYKHLSEETPSEAKEKHGPQFKTALAAYVYLYKNVRVLLYPLLLKLLSDRWMPFNDFFAHRRKRFAAFLGVQPADRLKAPAVEAFEAEAARAQAEAAAKEAENMVEAEDAALAAENAADEGQEEGEAEAEPPADTPAAAAPSSRAVTRALDTMDTLFPEAGWKKPDSWPDFFPYFSGVFEFKKGFELVAPTDPLHQEVVLMHVMEELFYGMRHIQFGTIPGADGEADHVGPQIERIIDGWHGHLEESLGKEYLPRLVEYCRLVEGPTESRTSNYAKRTLLELCWYKRLNFLPYLSFESAFTGHPFRKQEKAPLYSDVRDLRRLLTGVAAGIEAATKRGAPGNKITCDGIDNPWDLYSFQIPNPVSNRIDALLGGRSSRKRTNAALVFFALSAATALDSLINDKNSYAYASPAGCPFRSADGEGLRPSFEVEAAVDADAAFKRSLKARSAPADAQ